MGVKRRLLLYGGVTASFVALAAAIRAGGEWWWAAACLVLLTTAFLARLREPLPWTHVFGVGLLCRLILFPLPPCLSGDVYRYLWDGLMQANGVNPFHHPPESAALADFHPYRLSDRVGSAPYHSVYPPVSQFLFHLVVRLVPSVAEGSAAAVYAMKALLGLSELMALWTLCRFRAHRFLPVLYAWNPLVVVETWGQVHTEGLALGLLAAAFFALPTGREGWTVAFVTLAGWVKLYPLLFLPLLACKPPFSRRRLFESIAIFSLLTGLLWLPFAGGASPVHYGNALDLYVSSFEFNALPYYVLKGFFGLGAGSLLRWVWLGFVTACWVQCARGRISVSQSGVWIAGTAVLTATTVHPWYFLLSLFIMALIGLHPPAHWLWLSGASFLTYLFYPFPSTYSATVTVIWVVWLALFLTELYRSPERALGWVRRTGETPSRCCFAARG